METYDWVTEVLEKLPKHDQYGFKEGDRVIISEDFDEHRWIGDPGVNDDMLKEKGTEHVIKFIRSNGNVWLEGSNWTWHVKWLNPFMKIEQVKDDELMSLFND